MPRSADPHLRQWWRELIQSFEPRHETVAQFCRRNAVSTASFYNWKRKLANTSTSQEKEPTPARQQTESDDAHAFLPVQLIGSAFGPDDQPLQVHLPGGVRIEVPATHGQQLWGWIDHLTSTREENR